MEGGDRTRAGSSGRMPRLAAMLILVIGAACLVYILVGAAQLWVDEPDQRVPAQLDYLLLVSAGVFTIVGCLILIRTEGNRVGWVMSAIGLALFVGGVAAVLSDRGEPIAEAIGGAIWLSWFVLVGLLMYWFPTGRPVTPRWRFLGWWGMVVLLLSLSYVVSDQLCVDEGPDRCEAWIDNPIGISGVPNPEYGAFSSVGYMALAGFLILAAVSLVVRLVRSKGVERLQMKWFVFAVITVIVVTIAQETLSGAIPVPLVIWCCGVSPSSPCPSQ
jgi:hypothetical protein